MHRTYYDGSITHVTGIVNISGEDYKRMPSQFNGQWLRRNFPHVANAMDNFIAKIKQETNGEIVGEPGYHPNPTRTLSGSSCDQS